MTPETATARIFLASCFFLLPVFLVSQHVAAADASPPLSFSFDFSNTSKYRLGDLRFEGDAALNGDLVDLTCNSDTTYYCSGRMSYNNPVPFYNNNTGEVASFVTTFTFAIKLWPNTTKKGDGTECRQGRVAALVLLSLVVLLGIWLILSSWRVKRKRGYFGKHSRLQRLAYDELSNATGKFSEANKLGAGSFGVVYRGSLRNKEVAVKKIRQDAQGQFRDFIAELGTISGTGHKNVVSLEGWCCSVSNFMFWCCCRQDVQLFIVYELVPNGDLHEHLYDKTKVLPWAMRYKVVIGLYSALHYLHHQCRPYILHRDIKPSNILLDNEFNPKLGDFGLSRAAERNDATSVPTQVAAGTMRYMDPLTMTDGEAILRRCSDVYSFGIVLLEIAHGEYDAALFRRLHTDRPTTFVEDVADKRLDKFDRAQMERVIVLGLRCSEHDANKRPSLDAETLRFLEKGGELRAATVHKDEPQAATAHARP
ncbi:unnamed protein product [Alopecurus aequalis]